jgi:ArsR family transcriptional regulator, lead/cadmium/zinc/bismuth-responsive transcriptional repressor
MITQLFNHTGDAMAQSNGLCDVTFIHKGKVSSARRNIPDSTTIQRMSEIFQVLGDPTRLKVCLALSKEELCVCDIAALLGTTDSAISHQLAMLKHLRMVKYRKDGRMAYYSLDDEHIEDLIRLARRHGEE